jgi:predicted lysophospholipase L1 biosynthesis ABC-type transport system permease subunit
MNKFMEKSEAMIAGWLKPLPQLPTSACKWVAENIWWITMLGAVLSAIGTLFMIFAFMSAITLVGVTTGVYGSYVVSAAYTGIAVFTMAVAILFMIATVGIIAKAVTPLKNADKKGWSLLFWLLMLRALAVVCGAVLTYSFFGFIASVIYGGIGLAIAAYLLFEIKSYFIKVEKSKTTHHTDKK